jgi:Domain of unknown function (DUF4845)
MRILRQQHGMTPLGILTILVLVAFGAYLILRLAPVYIENYAVASSLKSLKQDMEIKEKAPEQVYESLKRRFEINDVKNVKKDNIKIARSGGIMTVDVKYNVTVPLISNISLLVAFEDHVSF